MLTSDRGLSKTVHPERLRIADTQKEKLVATKIFVNLPVKDLQKSVAFYTRLGYKFNPQFTDETATCMIVSEDIFVMLLTHPKFKTFIPNAICDAQKSTEVLLAVSVESRGKVDEMISNAMAAGGKTFRKPEDHGFMYYHAYQDPDGHIWEVTWLDPSAARQG